MTDKLPPLPDGFELVTSDPPLPDGFEEISRPSDDGDSYSAAPWKTTASKYYRQMLEGLGSGVGALVGTASTLGPWGAIPGGVLGYGIGTESANVVDTILGIRSKRSIVEAPESFLSDVETGLKGEAIGLGAGKAAQVASKIAAPLGTKIARAIEPYLNIFKSQKGAEKATGRTLAEHTSPGDLYAKNAEGAEAVEAAVPNLKFSYAELRNDPNLIGIERSQARSNPAARQGRIERTAENDRALYDFFDRTFKGDASKTIDDFMISAKVREEALSGREDAAKAEIEKSAESLSRRDAEDVGSDILDLLNKAKGREKERIGALYSKIPGDAEIRSGNLLADAEKIMKPEHPYESPGNFPETIERYLSKERAIVNRTVSELTEKLKTMGELRKDAHPKIRQMAQYIHTMGFKDLRGLRSETLNEMRKIPTDTIERRRLARFLGSIEQTISQLSDSSQYGEDMVSAYRTASKEYAAYKEIFGKAGIGKIVRRGPSGEVSAVSLHRIPSMVFKSGDKTMARKFFLATGPEGKNAFVAAADYDMLKSVENPVTGEIQDGKLKAWLRKNNSVLSEAGIRNRYDDIVSGTRNLSEIRGRIDAFRKSSVADAIGADPERAVDAMLSGTNPAKKMRDTLKLLRSDSAATEGLENAVADYMMRKLRLTKQDVMEGRELSLAGVTRFMDKHEPTLKVLYEKSPEKLAALRTIHKAIAIQSRAKASPLGGGSDTAENIFGYAIANLPGSIFLRSVTKALGKWGDSAKNEYMARALFDPEYAQRLIYMAKRPLINSRRIEQSITAQMAKLGYYARDKEK